MEKAGPQQDLPEHDETTDRGAERRPEGIYAQKYGDQALRLLDNGYEPIPIMPGSKRPAAKRWTTVEIDLAQIERWSAEFADCGIGLRTGHLVAIDIDILDPDIAWQAGQTVEQRLGATLMRVGLWPKRLYMYRAAASFTKASITNVEVLGLGQQFVAFGIHPKTGQPYDWPTGETPLDVPLAALPLVDEAACQALLAELAAIVPSASESARASSWRAGATQQSGPMRDADGIVIDGRDGWLSILAFHAVHDAIDAGLDPEPGAIAQIVWQRFSTTTDLGRPRKNSTTFYDMQDCDRKVRDKLKLHLDGRLPPRHQDIPEPEYTPAGLAIDDARQALDVALGHSCQRILDWYQGGQEGPVPQLGIRATVGLGKSAVSRTHLLALRQHLAAIGAPNCILVFTPSHVLAEETAERWNALGMKVAVLRGYEAKHPTLKLPMCQDIEAVRAAVSTGHPIHPSVCSRSNTAQCQYFQCCLKQQNRDEVSRAEIVVAPYDVIFSGLQADLDRVGLLVVDEGCWARAVEKSTGLSVESFAYEGLRDTKWQGTTDRTAAAKADLVDLRQQVVGALMANGVGAVSRGCLLAAGLTRKACIDAMLIETDHMKYLHLFPGMPMHERKSAFQGAKDAERHHQVVAIWRALGELLGSKDDIDGRLRILPRDPDTGNHGLLLTGLKSMQDHMQSKPVIHLDATMRLDLARTIMPGLEMTEIDADAPHMHVRLISGSFGKTKLCQDPHAGAEENRRRAKRLAECVTYVCWQARRFTNGRVLVITNQSLEAAFAGIAGVSVAHFNAIAGLDAFRDIDLLIVIGRPLPSQTDLHPLSGAFFGHEPSGRYRSGIRSILMRDGSSRGVKVVAHEDSRAELLRAAICDDEVLQAVGRGRGVNRTAADPLEVHILANVALPLVHDELQDWSMVCPDIVQRMLLAGLAVDSPADAALLHPKLFPNVERAKKAFQRGAFGGHFPIRNIYREMSLKSGAYRKGGKGRSWQRAWWIDGTSGQARALLEAAVGPLAEWQTRGDADGLS